MSKIKWDDMYPRGFLACFSLRRMPIDLHKRIKRLAVEKGTSIEYETVMGLEAGVAMLEAEEFGKYERREV